MKALHIIVAVLFVVVVASAVTYVLTEEHPNDVRLTSVSDLSYGKGDISDFNFRTSDGRLIPIEDGAVLSNPVTIVYVGAEKEWNTLFDNMEPDTVLFLYYDEEDDTVYDYTITLKNIRANSISASIADGYPVLTFQAKPNFGIYFVQGGQWGGEADPEDEPGIDKTVYEYYFTTHDTGMEPNITLPAYYTDDYFSLPATVRNISLIDFALCLEMSCGIDSPDKTVRSSSVVKLLTDIGCTNVATNETYSISATSTSVDAAIGSKRIGDSTVIFLAMNGARYSTEFASNVMIGKTGDHEGFALVRDQGLQFLRNYIAENDIHGHVKILVTGFSRTAAGSNLLAKYISDAIAEGKVKERIGDIDMEQGDMYGFSFETPLCGYYEEGSGQPAPDDERYWNIWYVINPDDIVTYIPPAQYGFVRYGNCITVPSHDESCTEDMLKVVEHYLGKSAVKYFDMSGFVGLGGLSTMEDFNNGFITKFFDSLGSREHYADDIQDDFVTFMSVFMAYPDLLTKLMDETGGGISAVSKLYSYAGKEKAFKTKYGPIVNKVLKGSGFESYSEAVLNGLYEVSKLVNDYADGNKLNLIGDKYLTTMLSNTECLIRSHSTIMTLGYLMANDPNYAPWEWE